MIIIQKSPRRIKLERLAGLALDARSAERRAMNSGAAKIAHVRAIGASIAVLAFSKAADDRAVAEAAAGVDAALAPIVEAMNAGDWSTVEKKLPPLTDAVKAFATATGIPFDAPDGSASPAQLVGALEEAIAKQDLDAVNAALDGVAAALNAAEDQRDPPPRAAPPTTARARHGEQFVRAFGQTVRLSASEVAACNATGATLAQYASNKMLLSRARGVAPANEQVVRASRRGAGGKLVTLSSLMPGSEPPTSFRIFGRGSNATTKGTFLFDEQAAHDVMAEFEKHGVDIPIDLEHLSLDESSANFDPDARGWARLQVLNGELWAIGVTWTADGATRLRQKRQRYISPVFAFDSKTRRITSVLNIAITALPATHNLTPLVAASQ